MNAEEFDTPESQGNVEVATDYIMTAFRDEGFFAEDETLTRLSDGVSRVLKLLCLDAQVIALNKIAGSVSTEAGYNPAEAVCTNLAAKVAEYRHSLS